LRDLISRAPRGGASFGIHLKNTGDAYGAGKLPCGGLSGRIPEAGSRFQGSGKKEERGRVSTEKKAPRSASPEV